MFSCTHRSRPVDSDGNITRCSGTGLAFGVFFVSGAGLLPRTGRLRDTMTASCGVSVSPSWLSVVRKMEEKNSASATSILKLLKLAGMHMHNERGLAAECSTSKCCERGLANVMQQHRRIENASIINKDGHLRL
eukprot:5893-Heterococcus_DN1.PRE.3